MAQTSSWRLAMRTPGFESPQKASIIVLSCKSGQPRAGWPGHHKSRQSDRKHPNTRRHSTLYRARCGCDPYVMVDLMYHVVTDPGLKLYDIDGLITSLVPKRLKPQCCLMVHKGNRWKQFTSCQWCGSHAVQRLKVATHSVLQMPLESGSA